MIRTKTLVALVALLLPVATEAQTMLMPDDAVRIALENNYSIRIARNQATIAANNVTWGNAGFLPSLDVSASQNNNIQNARQVYFTGDINENDKARSNSINLNTALTWTLFDGLAMFTNYQKLQEFQEMGELTARMTIEHTIAGVMTSYYDLVRQKQRLQVIGKTLAISDERVRLAEEKLLLGAASRLEVLQAQVDYNADHSEQLNGLETYRTSKIRLNNLLARDINIDFDVAEKISDVVLPEWKTLYDNTLEANAGLLLNLADNRVANMQLRELAARRFPRLNLNMGYGFLNSESESGTFKSNRTWGMNYGVSASMNIFNGFDLNRQVANARIVAENAEIELSDYRARLEADLATAYLSLQSKIQLADFEEQNHKVATTNLEIAMERFRLGELSGIELREAQKNFLSAESRLITSRYQARAVEIGLKEISGRMME
ncbi:MAG: TolC family protein [Bacteroidales bacterium]|nr:TolC family protein [Bacteroidales bacterium]